MRAILKLAATLAVLVLGGCASAYGPDTWTGGYSERQLGNGDWSVTYLGNGFTTQETAQTYWLYRCSQLTLDKGYDGFELSNPVLLTAVEGAILRARARTSPRSYILRVQYGAPVYKPSMTGSIRMLKAPIPLRPGITFDAHALKALLDPLVNGSKCDGNVCPYVHTYLYPTKPTGS